MGKSAAAATAGSPVEPAAGAAVDGIGVQQQHQQQGRRFCSGLAQHKEEAAAALLQRRRPAVAASQHCTATQT